MISSSALLVAIRSCASEELFSVGRGAAGSGGPPPRGYRFVRDTLGLPGHTDLAAYGPGLAELSLVPVAVGALTSSAGSSMATTPGCEPSA